MKFKVTITESLEKVIEVEADNMSNAICLVEDQYRSGDIVLTADDYTCTEYTVEETD